MVPQARQQSMVMIALGGLAAYDAVVPVGKVGFRLGNGLFEFLQPFVTIFIGEPDLHLVARLYESCLFFG